MKNIPSFIISVERVGEKQLNFCQKLKSKLERNIFDKNGKKKKKSVSPKYKIR